MDDVPDTSEEGKAVIYDLDTSKEGSMFTSCGNKRACRSDDDLDQFWTTFLSIYKGGQ